MEVQPCLSGRCEGISLCHFVSFVPRRDVLANAVEKSHFFESFLAEDAISQLLTGREQWNRTLRRRNVMKILHMRMVHRTPQSSTAICPHRRLCEKNFGWIGIRKR